MEMLEMLSTVFQNAGESFISKLSHHSCTAIYIANLLNI